MTAEMPQESPIKPLTTSPVSGFFISMKPPAFQFYADDFLAGTIDMSAEEVGAYIRLLCRQWACGEIPVGDAAKLSRVAGVAVSADVLGKFPEGKNPRLERERAKQNEYREAKSQSGRIGAEKRWQRHGTPNGTPIDSPLANGMAKNGSPSPKNTLAPKARERNPVIDALACIDGSQLDQITEPAWAAAGKALSQIKAVTPEISADEIRRRAQNYRTKYRDATISPRALAKHWAALTNNSNNGRVSEFQDYF